MRRLARPLFLLPLLLAVLVVACSDADPRISAPESPALDASPASAIPDLQQLPAFQPGVVVARFAPGAAAADIAAAHGAVLDRTMPQGIRVLRVPVGREQTVMRALSRSPGVVFAELSVPRLLGIPCAAPDGDCTMPSDQHFGRRWDLHNDGAIRDSDGQVIQTAGLVPDADMDWLEAYDALGSFAGDVLIGVVDTGIDPNHEDLAGRLLVQRDFFNIDNIAEDDHGHGTHVSGIMLAHADNLKGGAGVAWGPGVRLAVAKGCGNTIIGYLCWSPDIADGIMWLADQGAAVINLSLGGESPSSAEQVALQYAVANDVLPVCAAGNNGGAVGWPAAFPECVAVSSTRWDDALASYSSRGPEIEVAAPGGEIIHAEALDRILSTWPGGGYAYLSGTSMASPQVTGLAGLLHALGVAGADAKRSIIQGTADDLGAPGVDELYGAGRINIWAAVREAVDDPPPPPPDNEAPTAAFSADCADLSCTFTDLSTDDGGVQEWQWDFGDGTVSPVRNPSHEYAAAGTWTVTLLVTDGGGLTDTAARDVTVTDPPPPPPNEPPTASFTFSCSGPTCQFTDTSTDDVGVEAWLWDFGDGVFSDERNPSHTYAPASYPATYAVSLLVEDADMELDLVSQDVTVTEPPPVLSLAGQAKVKGELITDLTWSGATGPVDLYRDGGLIAAGVPSDPGTYRDFTGSRGKATFVYEACHAGTTVCSDPVTVVF